MAATPSIRTVLFKLGIAATVLSGAVLIGTFARHVQATDYLKQADEGLPWVDWGLGSAFLGFVLCWFGTRLTRVASVTIAFLLFVYWLLAAESLY